MAEKSTKVADELDELRAEVERLTAALDEAKGLIREGIEDGATTAREKAEEIGERVQDGLSDLQKQIDAHPLPSAIIAFAIGLLIGRVVSR
jgi:ElaB/YqjD/DUF883 family membrane-anchored ribosome-binding protein